ncbi:four-carbon acid sugar kinase family protein [Saccharopolyspora griseoalba]|uniref:Four-carbon acid sugar kinase family protein n=1 Tax=Saccharopolyspora griseoalba TaxID=1431848 RepID=A0ABW2LQT3_9PSEU
MSDFSQSQPIPVEQLLTGLPAVRAVDPAEAADRVAGGPCLVVLDDDPTGTQTVADLPVLTTWSVDDLRWALTRPGNAFFVLTNTRSLSVADAEARNREVIDALAQAAEAEQVDFVVASRSDSTLRGHFPRETDVLAEELARRGKPVDGVVIVPAFPSAGRFTIDSVHWARTADGMLPAGRTEFAEDATFGYRSSDLREWVEEKTGGRAAADQVLPVTLADLREGGPERVAELLGTARDRQPVVVDAAGDDDLRVLALALLRAEEAGKRLLYRVGPAFVRSRAGQAGSPPLDVEALRAMGAADGHGLIAVGSHVGLTTGQLDGLRELGGITELELDVAALLEPSARDDHVAEVSRAAAEAMSGADVVIRTSRTPVTGSDPDASLAIARAVSAGLVDTVRATVRAHRPAFVVAKGGITSSDIATDGLDVRRAVVRGTMLPGIVSLWEPVSGEFAGVPYVVFPGNVGDRGSLAEVVSSLRGR